MRGFKGANGDPKVVPIAVLVFIGFILGCRVFLTIQRPAYSKALNDISHKNASVHIDALHRMAMDRSNSASKPIRDPLGDNAASGASSALKLPAATSALQNTGAEGGSAATGWVARGSGTQQRVAEAHNYDIKIIREVTQGKLREEVTLNAAPLLRTQPGQNLASLSLTFNFGSTQPGAAAAATVAPGPLLTTTSLPLPVSPSPEAAGAVQQPSQQPLLANSGGATTGAGKPALGAVEKQGPTLLYNLTLTREVVQLLTAPQGGYLFFTAANSKYAQFAVSWAHNLKAAGLNGYLVGSMDEDAVRYLANREVYTFSINSGLPTDDYQWGSKVFAAAQLRKVQLMAQLLRFGVQLVVTDVDVMWMRNPLPFFMRFSEADILISSDRLKSTVGTEEALEHAMNATKYAFNVGLILLREGALPVVDLWAARMDPNVTDKVRMVTQITFNNITKTGLEKLPDDPKHYFLGANKTVKMGLLPVLYFCSGHTYFTQHVDRTLDLNPYAVHATYQFGGTAGKVNRFREAMLFWDEWEHFRPEGDGFIAYEPNIPQELLDAAGPPGNLTLNATNPHFNLVNHQLREMRQAMALATILNRTLIMPELRCGLDRFWAPHHGTAMNTSFKLPFLCPLDHVVNLAAMSYELPVKEFGPQIHYREHSFLQNPRLDPKVVSSAIYVSPCEVPMPQCVDGKKPSTVEGSNIYIVKGLDSESIKRALSVVKHTPLLLFSSMEGAFGNFTDPDDYQKFFKRLQVYGDVWGTIPKMKPAHVYYDFWWDIPHKDRFGREYGEWEVRPGPQIG